MSCWHEWGWHEMLFARERSAFFSGVCLSPTVPVFSRPSWERHVEIVPELLSLLPSMTGRKEEAWEECLRVSLASPSCPSFHLLQCRNDWWYCLSRLPSLRHYHCTYFLFCYMPVMTCFSGREFWLFRQHLIDLMTQRRRRWAARVYRKAWESRACRRSFICSSSRAWVYMRDRHIWHATPRHTSLVCFSLHCISFSFPSIVSIYVFSSPRRVIYIYRWIYIYRELLLLLHVPRHFIEIYKVCCLLCMQAECFLSSPVSHGWQHNFKHQNGTKIACCHFSWATGFMFT